MVPTPRQQEILRALVVEYVSSAEPVSSQLLVERLPQIVSSATVRNDLLALEEAGFLEQPHTSAGRVPTAKGYQYFIANFLMPSAEQGAFSELAVAPASEDRWRSAAKKLSAMTTEVVLISNGNAVFTVGMSNLFSQPEADDAERLQKIYARLEHSEELMAELQKIADDEVKILVGAENPVSDGCALLLTRCGQKEGVVAILGFMRMSYNKNIALLLQAKKLLENFYE